MKIVEIMVHITPKTNGNAGALIWVWLCPSEKVWHCAQTKSHWKL